MVKEWFESIFTRTAPIYRKLGYVYASVALQARFSRCKNAWENHNQNCHLAIINALPKQTAIAGSVLVVGSGPLYEVPLKELLSRYKRIVLLDVVHPRAVQRLAKHEPRIELLTCDITGFAAVSNAEEKVRNLKFSPPEIAQRFDLIISANILSQLPLEPYAAARKKWQWANDSYFKKLAAKMSVDHAHWLKSLSAPLTLLIADTERIYFDVEGKEMERVPSAETLPMGTLVRHWEWEIAPLGEVSRKFSYRMHVECRRL
jgi:hypothetical protein